jgi:hypothetical protein
MPRQEAHCSVPFSHKTKNLSDPFPLPNLANKRRYPVQTKYSGLDSRRVTPEEHLSKSQPIDVKRLERIAKYGSGVEKVSVPVPVVEYNRDGNRLSLHTSTAVNYSSKTSSNQPASKYASYDQLQCIYPTPAPTSITHSTHLTTSPQTLQWQQSTPTTGAEALNFISQHSGPRNPHLANASSAEAFWKLLGRNEKVEYLKGIMLSEGEGEGQVKGEN